MNRPTEQAVQPDHPAVHLPTVIAVAALVYALAIALHELGHAAVGQAVGGHPSLISSTDARGDWSGVSRAGFVGIGVAGSLVNWLLAAVGLGLGRSLRRGAGRLFAWLLFAVNGSLAGVYMTVSPLIAFGDWDTVLSRFELHLPLRLLTAAAGALLTAWVVRSAARWLARGLPREGTRAAALRLTRTAWLAGGATAVVAALLSPLGLGWALFIATGSTLGCTWPLMVAGRRAAESTGVGDDPFGVPPSPAWIVAGVVVAAGFILLFGPGIRL